ncbi:acyltransferase family protein [Sphingobium sp. B2]|uniref:acyltransferase family protein n=1 Tax=Sphingobium sp. B2 TaxID=2583228 RepID=UPI0011A7FAF9|nr:acyltransferase [Sphingobium sp. B2]
MTIDDDLLKPERNNLTLVRLVLASAVILTHCYWRVHHVGGQDQFSTWLGVPLSVYAVDGFFFLSGFLVYGSLRRRAHAGRFMVARLARMMPALVVSVLLTVLIGAFFTRLPPIGYLGGETARFVGNNLSLMGGHYSLSGIMCGARPCVINGSLWTLHWEMLCYLLLAAAALVGLSRARPMLMLVIPATVLVALLVHLPFVHAILGKIGGKGGLYFVEYADRLWTLFAAGIAAQLLRDRIRLSWAVLLLLTVANLLAHRWNINYHVQTLFVGYAVLCLGLLSAKNGAISGRWPDYSYGMYIYAFPVMMLAAGLMRIDNYLLLALMNFAFTLPLAALSWHFVEKPVLELVRNRRQRATQDHQPTIATAG